MKLYRNWKSRIFWKFKLYRWWQESIKTVLSAKLSHIRLLGNCHPPFFAKVRGINSHSSVRLSVCPSVYMSQNFTLSIPFEHLEVGLLYFTCTFLVMFTFSFISKRLTLWPLTWTIDLVPQNITMCNKFWTIRGKAVIYNVHCLSVYTKRLGHCWIYNLNI